MAKIPVGATIAHAYRFTFGNFLDILKVIWVPNVIGMAIGFFIQGHATELSAAAEAQLFARAGQLFLMLLPFYLAVFFLFFMQMEGAMRYALGLLPQPGLYYLQFGRPLWRLIGATLLACVILFAGGLAAALSVVVLSALFALVSGTVPTVAAGLSIIVLSLIVYCALIYAAVRLLYFLAAVAIAEEQVALKRSWALGGGNFWRILGVAIGALGPLLLVLFVLIFSYTGLPPMPEPGMDPEIFQQASRAWQAAMTARMTSHWYIVYPVSLLANVLFFGLSCGAQASAYRAVTRGDGPWSSASHP